MVDVQSVVFRWAQQQTEASALVVFILGMLFGLQGFRFARVLLALVCGAGGFLLGAMAGVVLGVTPELVSLPLAGILGAAALWKYRFGVSLASTFTFAALGHYVSTRFDAMPSTVLITWLVGGFLGLSLYHLHVRQTPILVTTILGAALMIVGFIGLASGLAPSLAETFVATADSYRLMVPVLGIMLCVLGYSVQANAWQGDIKSGGANGWNSVEVE